MRKGKTGASLTLGHGELAGLGQAFLVLLVEVCVGLVLKHLLILVVRVEALVDARYQVGHPALHRRR
jgi:hypothetical protein